jgi:succinylglutamate desuccinylase
MKKNSERIEEIKQELQDIGEMRPGCLSKQIYYRNDKKYPYYQISYTYRMKSHTEYVRDELVAEVSEQIKNYCRFKRQTNR